MDAAGQPGTEPAPRDRIRTGQDERNGQPTLLILAKERVAAQLERYGLKGEIIATAPGQALDGVRFAHPFYDRTAPVYVADYVTIDTGTGLVHSAPRPRGGRLPHLPRLWHEG